MGRGDGKTAYSKADWDKKMAAVKVTKGDMNRLVMNFLVTEGYVEAAKTFERESGTTPGVDLDALVDRMEIRKSVQSGDMERAIEQVNDLNPEILEEKQGLFFHLQQQQLIELIRQNRTEEALEFAQEYLAPRVEENPSFMEDLERTVALLAFENVHESPVSDLVDVSQRQKTASELNAAILKSMDQDEEARIPSLLKMMIWSQNQLDAKAEYPKIDDLTTAELTYPTAD